MKTKKILYVSCLLSILVTTQKIKAEEQLEYQWPEWQTELVIDEAGNGWAKLTGVNYQAGIPVYYDRFYMPDYVEANGKQYEIREIAPNAFAGDTEIHNFKISPNVKIIRQGAFEGCKGISTIILNSDMELIENNVFAGCEPKSVVIMESATTLNLSEILQNADLSKCIFSLPTNRVEHYMHLYPELFENYSQIKLESTNYDILFFGSETNHYSFNEFPGLAISNQHTFMVRKNSNFFLGWYNSNYYYGLLSEYVQNFRGAKWPTIDGHELSQEELINPLNYPFPDDPFGDIPYNDSMPVYEFKNIQNDIYKFHVSGTLNSDNSNGVNVLNEDYESCRIYDINGNEYNISAEQINSLMPGLYIIKSPSSTRKVLIK